MVAGFEPLSRCLLNVCVTPFRVMEPWNHGTQPTWGIGVRVRPVKATDKWAAAGAADQLVVDGAALDNIVPTVLAPRDGLRGSSL